MSLNRTAHVRSGSTRRIMVAIVGALATLTACGTPGDDQAAARSTASDIGQPTTEPGTPADGSATPTRIEPTDPATASPASAPSAQPAPDSTNLPPLTTTPTDAAVPSYLLAGRGSGDSTDLVASLTPLAELHQLSPRGDDGLVVLGAIPEALAVESVFVAGGSDGEYAAYSLVVSHAVEERPEDDATFSISVATAEGNSEANLENSGRKVVAVGPHRAWLGRDASPDCPMDGSRYLSDNVLTWIDDGLEFAVNMTPIPECQPHSPLTVEDAVAAALNLVVCSGWAEGSLTCEPYIMSGSD